MAHPGHRMKWFVWSGSEKMRHQATMRGMWGWDVECECGWKTHTGGATKGYVRGEVDLHWFITRNGEPDYRGDR
jgi:hypothetical protein